MTVVLEGKIALITGGSSGIGRATALAFARRGGKVVIADVDIKGGEETVRMIKEMRGEALFVKTDVSKAAEVEAVINKAVKTYGRLDCAHNNAGIGTLGARPFTAECTEENWDRIISINLKGVWLCMKYEIPQMLKQGGGAIVNTSSVAGLVGLAGASTYAASKHGVIGLTKTAALEYAPKGIRINAVCPGLIHTPLIERISSKGPDFEKARLGPIGRMGTPEEVAEAVVWLCSEAASFVTGHAMAVDGGKVAM